MLKGFHCLLLGSFFLKSNTKSKMLRNNYMICSLKRLKINRKKGNKNTLGGCL